MTPIFADFGLGEALLVVLEIFFVVIWPVLTVLIYLIARGGGMRNRAIQEQKHMQQASEEYIRSVAGSSPVDQLHRLDELRARGAISQEEFERLKARVLS